MRVIQNDINVEAPADFVLKVSNDLERWPLMMEDYREVRVLRQEGLKIWFRLTHASGAEWTSWRLISPEGYFAIAERWDPRLPFEFMQLIWRYERIDEYSTRMIWTMAFELPSANSHEEDESESRFAEHAVRNQGRMKLFIEREWKTLASATKVDPTSAHQEQPLIGDAPVGG